MNTQSSQQAEWIDTKKVKAIFSIGKTTLYRLAATGKIESASLREDNKHRGKRLFSCASIRKLLKSLAERGDD